MKELSLPASSDLRSWGTYSFFFGGPLQSGQEFSGLGHRLSERLFASRGAADQGSNTHSWGWEEDTVT